MGSSRSLIAISFFHLVDDDWLVICSRVSDLHVRFLYPVSLLPFCKPRNVHYYSCMVLRSGLLAFFDQGEIWKRPRYGQTPIKLAEPCTANYRLHHSRAQTWSIDRPCYISCPALSGIAMFVKVNATTRCRGLPRVYRSVCLSRQNVSHRSKPNVHDDTLGNVQSLIRSWPCGYEERL